jgi:adenylate cyclase
MRRYFQDWLFFVVLWVIITSFFSFIFLELAWSFIDLLNLSDKINNEPMLKYMVSDYQYLESVMFGVLFGSASFGINLVADRTIIHSMPFGRAIIIKTLLYFGAIAVIFFLMFGILTTTGISPVSSSQYKSFLFSHTIPSSMWLLLIGFFSMSTLLVNFIALVSKKFGPGQMLLIFLGRYNKPLTENRIFMFLDLKDSTAIAERLGHIIYSRLLQQCFQDLNKLIPNSGAEIYQYVGDEAVLSWKIKHLNSVFVKPLQLFFDFKKRLEKKEKFYRSKFGLIPEFKAGLNAGVVTVAEIGDLKREIAYHGDVVNTASRLRSACNEFNKPLLASEYIIQNIDSVPDYEIHELGEVNLKGKKKSIKVYSIE